MAIIDGGARIAEVVLGWVIIGRIGVGAGALADADIADGLSGVALARATACVLSEPPVGSLPVGDDEDLLGES